MATVPVRRMRDNFCLSIMLKTKQLNGHFFPQAYEKKVVEDVIIPTLPNVGTALFDVCVEEKQ